jgi:hypothetical protein
MHEQSESRQSSGGFRLPIASRTAFASVGSAKITGRMLRREKGGEPRVDLPIYAWADAVENKVDPTPDPGWARELVRRREQRQKRDLEAASRLKSAPAAEDQALTRSSGSLDAEVLGGRAEGERFSRDPRSGEAFDVHSRRGGRGWA